MTSARPVGHGWIQRTCRLQDDDRGPSVANAQREIGSPASPASQAAHGHAERVADGDEVGLDELDRVRLAVRPLLVLTEDTVGRVVDEQELRVQPVLPGGRQLGQAVVDAAVAGHGERRRLPERGLRAERGRPRVAERSRAERIQEAARRERREVAGTVVRENGHVPRVDGIARQGSPDRPEQAELEVEAGCGEAVLDVLPAPRRPGSAPSSGALLEQGE